MPSIDHRNDSALHAPWQQTRPAAPHDYLAWSIIAAGIAALALLLVLKSPEQPSPAMGCGPYPSAAFTGSCHR